MSQNQDQEFSKRVLAWAAGRAGDWPHLFASVIVRYCALNDLGDEELCVYLECSLATLNRLRLFGRPDTDPSAFSSDIARISDKLHLDAGRLAAMVREVEATDSFGRGMRQPYPFSPRSSTSSTRSMLQAARDHDDDEGRRQKAEGSEQNQQKAELQAARDRDRDDKDTRDDTTEGEEK